MNAALKTKLESLPKDPGVYFHKSADGEVIYVGKAAVLRNRVRQYFQKSRPLDVKTQALVAEIHDTDWITVETELDALFLESEMIKRYKPRYNILLRDDKSQLYVRIPMKEQYPALTFTRVPIDDGATYYGPYYNGWAVKKALKLLRKAFPYSTHETMPSRVCLQYHLGLCPGVEEAKVSEQAYKKDLRRLALYLKGGRKRLIVELEKDMNTASKAGSFEEAAKLRDKIRDLKELQRQIIFSDKEFMDASKDQAQVDLQQLLGLPTLPRRIEGYDISHMQGTNNVASMVVATNGMADKAQYRKFKMHIPGNNDFAHMAETMSRRFSGKHTDWPQPDLVVIDGGKGQLSSAIEALDAAGISVPVIGLAKQEEEIVIHKAKSNVTLSIEKLAELSSASGHEGRGSSGIQRTVESLSGVSDDTEDFIVVQLAKSSHIIKLLQRIRDESHRFAVSYHTHLKRTGQVKSALDSIPGVGPATKRKLLLEFGSVSKIQQASQVELAKVIGHAKAKALKLHLAS